MIDFCMKIQIQNHLQFMRQVLFFFFFWQPPPQIEFLNYGSINILNFHIQSCGLGRTGFISTLDKISAGLKKKWLF